MPGLLDLSLSFLGECYEADEDDLQPDSEIIAKSSVGVPPPGVSADPKIQQLALQMQQAGDALYKQYEGRVEVIREVICRCH